MEAAENEDLKETDIRAQKLCIEKLLAKRPLIREITETKESALMKTLSVEVSKSASEGSPSFLNPPSVELAASNRKESNLDNTCYVEPENQLLPPKSLFVSSDSRFFNVSLSQETVIEEPSNADLLSNSSLNEANVEDYSYPIVDLNLLQEIFLENSNQSDYAESRGLNLDPIPGNNSSVNLFLVNTGIYSATDFVLDVPEMDSRQVIGSSSMRDDNTDAVSLSKAKDESSTDLLQNTAENVVQRFQNSPSNSMLNFLEQSIRSCLDERVYLIKKVSDILINLPFHLQLKPA
ncbi:hypothetical protein ACTXT7_005623 [Hymenolepis weldensis]